MAPCRGALLPLARNRADTLAQSNPPVRISGPQNVSRRFYPRSQGSEETTIGRNWLHLRRRRLVRVDRVPCSVSAIDPSLHGDLCSIGSILEGCCSLDPLTSLCQASDGTGNSGVY